MGNTEAHRGTEGPSVLVCGFYGNHNLGDEAMLAGMLSLLHHVRPGARVTVLSNDAVSTTEQHGVRAVGRDRNSLSDDHIRKHDVFILGGGDLIRDSVEYPVAQEWLSPLERAAALGLKTAVLGVSVGEIWKEETIALVPEVLNLVDVIAVRDRASRDRLGELGVRRDIHVMPDLSLFGLHPPCRSHEAAQTSRAGVSIRHLVGRGRSVNTGEQYPALQDALAAAADHLVDFGRQVHMIPCRTLPDAFHPVDDDYVASVDLARVSSAGEAFVLHRYLGSMELAVPVLQTMDLVIGTRLHSLVLAAGLGIPLIAVAYDPKVTNFMTEAGLSDFCIPIIDVTSERLVGAVDEVAADLVGLSHAVRAGMEKYRALGNTTELALSSLFGETG